MPRPAASRPGTCPTSWRRPTWPSARPAWSSCRTGPTTSTSAPASSTSWPVSSGSGIGLGTAASPTGPSRRTIATELANVPHEPGPGHRGHGAAHLDHRGPRLLPAHPRAVTDRPGHGHAGRCTPTSSAAGLKPNADSTYAAAQVVLGALNRAVAGAVADARAHHVTNVHLVDVAQAFDGHGICTADPWVFSGEPVPDATLAADADHILAAKACSGTDVLHGAAVCAALSGVRARRRTEPAGLRVARRAPDRGGTACPGGRRGAAAQRAASSRWRRGTNR